MSLEINDIYSQSGIRDILDVTIMRGMNYRTESNILVLVRNHVANIYSDRQEGEILYYTGEGRIGDQKLEGANKRLLNASAGNTQVHLFEVFTRTEYTYKGLVHLIDLPSQETQPDTNDNDRLVYVFPLQLTANALINNSSDVEKISKANERKVRLLDNEELEIRTKKSQNENPGFTYAKTKIYQRSSYVVVSVEKRANGICELCEKEAPFKKPNGNPYLEVHHIIQLASGGPDTITNAAALCPNCHRKMHSLGLDKDIKKLQEKAL